MSKHTEATMPESNAETGGPLDCDVGRDAVKEMLDGKITDAINDLIQSHRLHPQEAAEVLVDQAKAVLNALAWKPESVRMAERNLEEAKMHLAY